MQQKWNQNFDGEPMTDIPQKFLNAGCDVYMVMQLRHDEKILVPFLLHRPPHSSGAERAEDFGADVSLASAASFSKGEGR